MTNYKTIALIVAAGVGSRVGGSIPKQYAKIYGMDVLRKTAMEFLNHRHIDAVQIVYNPKDKDLYAAAVGDLDILAPVAGGKSRQESVRLGLENIEEFSPQNVLIHDAARPFVTSGLISDIIKNIANNKAVIPVSEVEDTLRKTDGKSLFGTVDRSKLVRVQTPQGFVYKEILTAHNEAKGKNFTDDAAIYEDQGMEIIAVSGSSDNFKITTKADLYRAEKIMCSNYDVRVGTGFDVHKFCEPKADENKIMLCGVAIPHSMSLEGHSDADVGLHAIVDAVLGAVGCGDIGDHFPPSDNKYKNMDSSVFLERACKLLAENNAMISNIDVTLICERPKISGYKKDMVAKISKILNISDSKVNVKATTTEGLGFTGRGEGIAAQAVATIKVRDNG